MHRGSFLRDIRLKSVLLSVLKHMVHEISQLRLNQEEKEKKKGIKPVNQEIIQTVYKLSESEKP